MQDEVGCFVPCCVQIAMHFMIFGRIKKTLFQEQSETEEPRERRQENLFSHHDLAEPTESMFPPHDQEEQTENTFLPRDQDQAFQEEQPMSDDVTADQPMKTLIPDQPMEKQLTDQPVEKEDTTLQRDKQQIATRRQTTSKRQKVKPFTSEIIIQMKYL